MIANGKLSIHTGSNMYQEGDVLKIMVLWELILQIHKICLHIYNGYIRIQGTNNHRLNINDDEIYKYGNSTLNIGTINNQSLIFKTSNSTRMTITGGGRIGIQETSPFTNFQVNQMTNSGTFSFDTDAPLFSVTTKTSSSVLNDPQTALYLTRQGTSGQSCGAMANFKLSRYEHAGDDSRTRFDINLAHGDFDDINVLTALSNGNIGLGINNPGHRLHVHETTSSTGLGYKSIKCAYWDKQRF